MIFKRSVVNYIIWGFLCVIVFAGIGVSAIGVSEAAENPAYLIYVGAFYGIFILGITILAIGFKSLKKPVEEKFGVSGIKLEGIMEVVFVFVVAITALIVRFSSAIKLFIDETGAGTGKGTGAYIEYALGNIPSLGTGENGAYLFTGLVKMLFGIFGENLVVVYVLQAILSLGIMIFVFYAIRNSVGKAAAWFAFLLLAFLPASVQQFLYCTPALMYGFLLSAYYLGIVELIHYYRNGKIEENRHLLYFGLAGLFAGFIAYFDISGLFLFPITIYAFHQMKFKTEIREKIDKSSWQSLVFAGCGLVFLLIALFAFPAGAPSGLTGIARYGMLFVPRDGIDITILAPYYGTWESAIIYMLAGLWLLEFVKTKKDRVFPLAVMAIVFVLFHFVTLDHVSYEVVMSLVFTMIGAIGLRYIAILFMPVEAESEEAMKEQLIDIENKRKERANAKFAKRIEKENKQGGRKSRKTNVITLGKDVHMEAPAEETAEEVKTEVAGVVATETVATETPATENAVAESAATETVAIETPETSAKETTAADSTVETVKEEVEKAETSAETKTETVVETKPEAIAEIPTETKDETSEDTTSEIATETKPETVEEVKTETSVETKAEVPAETKTENAEEIKTETQTETVATAEPVAEEPAAAESKPVKKELPPYVPMKMAPRGRRGKMFSPVKKAEGDFESNPEYMNRPMLTKKVEEPETNTATAVESVLVARAMAAGEAAPVSETAAAGETVAATETVANTYETVASAENVTEIATETVAETVTETTVAPAAETVAETATDITTETTAEPVTETVPETVAEVTTETVAEVTAETAAEIPAETKPEAVTETVQDTSDNKAETKGIETAEGTTETATETEVKAVAETAGVTATETVTETVTEPAAESVKEIKNVLPGPKPHVPKELVFDYDPTEEEMDFDIKDLTGKDFYDV